MAELHRVGSKISCFVEQKFSHGLLVTHKIGSRSFRGILIDEQSPVVKRDLPEHPIPVPKPALSSRVIQEARSTVKKGPNRLSISLRSSAPKSSACIVLDDYDLTQPIKESPIQSIRGLVERIDSSKDVLLASTASKDSVGGLVYPLKQSKGLGQREREETKAQKRKQKQNLERIDTELTQRAFAKQRSGSHFAGAVKVKTVPKVALGLRDASLCRQKRKSGFPKKSVPPLKVRITMDSLGNSQSVIVSSEASISGASVITLSKRARSSTETKDSIKLKNKPAKRIDPLTLALQNIRKYRSPQKSQEASLAAPSQSTVAEKRESLNDCIGQIIKRSHEERGKESSDNCKLVVEKDSCSLDANAWLVGANGRVPDTVPLSLQSEDGITSSEFVVDNLSTKEEVSSKTPVRIHNTRYKGTKRVVHLIKAKGQEEDKSEAQGCGNRKNTSTKTLSKVTSSLQSPKTRDLSKSITSDVAVMCPSPGKMRLIEDTNMKCQMVNADAKSEETTRISPKHHAAARSLFTRKPSEIQSILGKSEQDEISIDEKSTGATFGFSCKSCVDSRDVKDEKVDVSNADSDKDRAQQATESTSRRYSGETSSQCKDAADNIRTRSECRVDDVIEPEKPSDEIKQEKPDVISICSTLVETSGMRETVPGFESSTSSCEMLSGQNFTSLSDSHDSSQLLLNVAGPSSGSEGGYLFQEERMDGLFFGAHQSRGKIRNVIQVNSSEDSTFFDAVIQRESVHSESELNIAQDQMALPATKSASDICQTVSNISLPSKPLVEDMLSVGISDLESRTGGGAGDRVLSSTTESTSPISRIKTGTGKNVGSSESSESSTRRASDSQRSTLLKSLSCVVRGKRKKREHARIKHFVLRSSTKGNGTHPTGAHRMNISNKLVFFKEGTKLMGSLTAPAVIVRDLTSKVPSSNTSDTSEGEVDCSESAELCPNKQLESPPWIVANEKKLVRRGNETQEGSVGSQPRSLAPTISHPDKTGKYKDVVLSQLSKSTPVVCPTSSVVCSSVFNEEMLNAKVTYATCSVSIPSCEEVSSKWRADSFPTSGTGRLAVFSSPSVGRTLAQPTTYPSVDEMTKITKMMSPNIPLTFNDEAVAQQPTSNFPHSLVVVPEASFASKSPLSPAGKLLYSNANPAQAHQIAQRFRPIRPAPARSSVVFSGSDNKQDTLCVLTKKNKSNTQGWSRKRLGEQVPYKTDYSIKEVRQHPCTSAVDFVTSTASLSVTFASPTSSPINLFAREGVRMPPVSIHSGKAPTNVSIAIAKESKLPIIRPQVFTSTPQKTMCHVIVVTPSPKPRAHAMNETIDLTCHETVTVSPEEQSSAGSKVKEAGDPLLDSPVLAKYTESALAHPCPATNAESSVGYVKFDHYVADKDKSELNPLAALTSKQSELARVDKGNVGITYKYDTALKQISSDITCPINQGEGVRTLPVKVEAHGSTDGTRDKSGTVSDAGLSSGDVVWGKVYGHGWWPGRILRVLKTTESASDVQVAWFGSQTQSTISTSVLVPFESNFKAKFRRQKKGSYRSAVNEARAACDMDKWWK